MGSLRASEAQLLKNLQVLISPSPAPGNFLQGTYRHPLLLATSGKAQLEAQLEKIRVACGTSSFRHQLDTQSATLHVCSRI